MKLNYDLVKKAEQIREENTYRSFWFHFDEALENKEKWEREMIAISYGYSAYKYFHFGGYLLHPYRNWLIQTFPRAASSYGNDNWASYEMHPWPCTKDRLPSSWANSCEPKFKKIDVRHSDILNYKIEPFVAYPELKLKYRVDLNRIEEFDWLSRLTELERSNDLKTINRFYHEQCFECSDKAVSEFQKIHDSLPSEAIKILPFNEEKEIKELKEEIKRYKDGLGRRQTKLLIKNYE